MERIIIVDLSKKTIQESPYDYKTETHYGRGLALSLLKEHSAPNCGRLGEGNALVFVPGIVTGNQIPCATRALVMTKGEGKRGLLVSSFTGDLPQKLATLHVAAIVIKGRAEDKNAILYLEKGKVCFLDMPELKEQKIPEMVEIIRSRFGRESAIWGVGRAADMMLQTATYFATYPEGTPRFSCPRNGFGNVAGSKGLRAIIVKEGNYFGASCENAPSLQQHGKKLTNMIVQDKICGGALPGLGSITLLHLLKDRKELPPIEKKAGELPSEIGGKRINTCCAPMCVIGCLNRHRSNSGEVYGAPAESEVRAALSHRFGEESATFAKQVNEKGFSVGIDTVEFVNTVAVYLKAMHLEYEQERVLALLDEVEAGTVLGRIMGGGTEFVSSLYKEREELQQMITRPAVSKESQVRVKLERLYPEMEEVGDLELLYQQVFLLENMGICIFTSFALLNNREALELMAQIVTDKVGKEVTVSQLLEYAKKCIDGENEYQKEMAHGAVQKSIPEFIKVLYSYFEV